MRGEHSSPPLLHSRGHGSSPRAWGTPLGRNHVTGWVRFIPTCVGNTSRSTPWGSRRSVHPHVRGEHTGSRSAVNSPPGSSPRAWGTRQAPNIQHPKRRFIPTCVGNTASPPLPAPAAPVHPHVRGEHDIQSGRLTRSRRFIPTCVGNTRAPWVRGSLTSVHPHVRGEHFYFVLLWVASRGSSPRAWGTRLPSKSSIPPSRFIPTCVGNTPNGVPYESLGSVHPHVRGEHAPSGARGRGESGSSPRAWGTRDRRTGGGGSIRFIPTCVGNTVSSATVCSTRVGSSPRAWGTRWQRQPVLMLGRFIPTCVGNTPH